MTKEIIHPHPTFLNKTIYSSDSLVVNHLLRWDHAIIWESRETGILKVLLAGSSFNVDGKSTFAYTDGRRGTNLTFDYISDFSEGLALVGIWGQGYGYLNTKMEMEIPCQYEYARDFQNGYAVVSRVEGDKLVSGCIDKQGTFTAFYQKDGTQYTSIDDCTEGLFMVSSKEISPVAYFFENDPVGVFGFVNAQGEEVIPPQYISAHSNCSFENGIALVCKGHWHQDPKFANNYQPNGFWSDSILWGGIDKTGKVIMPCIFDEIYGFYDSSDRTDIYYAHFGGYENGKWGVIDREGKWIVEPQFSGKSYGIKDGLVEFYKEEKFSHDSEPMGIYDIKNKKMLFDEYFSHVSLYDNDVIGIERFDEKLGRTIEELRNRKGEVLFPSEYSSIYAYKYPYEVMIRDESGDKHGLIDEKGNVILPCKYDTPWNGIRPDLQRIVFNNGEKQGLMDFKEHILIPADYTEISHIEKDMWKVSLDKKHGAIFKNGDVVIPLVYDRIIRHNQGRLICYSENIGTDIYEVEFIKPKNT